MKRTAYRRNGWRGRPAAYWAAFAHRVSGLLLAAFLPWHFWLLGQALEAEALDSALRWREQWPVRGGETVLVGLLAIHLAGGLRVMALEMLPWRNASKGLAAGAAGFSFAIALLFALSAMP